MKIEQMVEWMEDAVGTNQHCEAVAAILALLRAMAAVEGELPKEPPELVEYRHLLANGATVGTKFSDIVGYADALRTTATALLAKERSDAECWRFGVVNGFPEFHRQTYPEEILLGWRLRSQNPPNGKEFNESDYPYYKSAEDAIDAARRGGEGK